MSDPSQLEERDPAADVSIHLDRGYFCVFEIPLSRLELPGEQGLSPLETRPGFCELLVNVAHIAAGGVGVELEDAWEVDFGVRIETAASRDAAAMAPTATLVRHVSSANATYVETCREADYPLFAAEGLTFELGDDGLSVRVGDAGGQILAFELAPPGTSFEPFLRHGQEVVTAGDTVYRYNYRFAGRAAMSASAGAAAGARLYPHPFFRGVDLASGSPVCREQMVLEPSRRSTITYLTPADEA